MNPSIGEAVIGWMVATAPTAPKRRPRVHVRCGICQESHYPKCRAAYATWPTAALYAIAKDRSSVTRLAYGAMPEFIDDRTADRWAVKLGFHPEQVWPGWCEAALTAGDDLFVNGSETAGPGWRQSWDWLEQQRAELVGGTENAV